METSGTLTLVDELSGDNVSIEGGRPAAEVLEARLADGDHPRSDFRGQPLEFRLEDSDGDPLPPERVLDAGDTIRLVSPDAADVIERRDRWLEEISVSGGSTTSVSTGTQLALVERTGSRLDDVARLRAELAARRTPPPSPRSRVQLGGAVLTVLVLVIVAAIFAAWGWWFFDEVTSASAAGRGGNGVDIAREEIAIAEPPIGPDVAVTVAAPGVGLEPPGDGCDLLEIGEVELPAEDEFEIGCEVAHVVFVVGDDGGLVEISARSDAGDPIVWLYDETGAEIGFNDDSSGLNSFLSVEVDAGQHELRVGNLTNQSSSIELSIELS